MTDISPLLDRIKARGREATERKSRNREEMPQTTAFVDEFRRVFSNPVWGRFTEAGRTVEWGKRSVEGGQWVTLSLDFSKTIPVRRGAKSRLTVESKAKS